MRRPTQIGLFVVGMLVGYAGIAHAQTSASEITIEPQFGIGFTAVDKAAWSGVTTLSDWNQTAYTIRGRVFFLPLGNARLGVEYGHQYLWYYALPFGGTTLTRDVTAENLNAVIRLPSKSRLVVDVGAGFHFFGDFTDFGALASIGYKIPINDKITLIPGGRADFVFDSVATLVPLTGTVTLSIKLR